VCWPHEMRKNDLVKWIDIKCGTFFQWQTSHKVSKNGSSQNILGGVVTTLLAAWPRNRGLIRGRRKRFNFPQYVQADSGAYTTPWRLHTGGCFPGVKRLQQEADYSPLSSAEVSNDWRYASTPPYAFFLCTRATLPLLYY